MTLTPPLISSSPGKILDYLLCKSALHDFGLALYNSEGQLLVMQGPQTAFCGAAGNLLCSEECQQGCKRGMTLGKGDEAPCLLNCPAGMWHYLLPCRTDTGSQYVLVAGGVRGRAVNLPYLEELARHKGLSAHFLLEFWDGLPALSRQEMLEAGNTLRQLLVEATPAKIAAHRSPACTSTPPRTGCSEPLGEPSATQWRAQDNSDFLLAQLKSMSTAIELRDLCRLVLETATQLTKAGKGSLMLLDGNAGKLRLQASLGMNRAMADNLSIQADQGISGLVTGSGQPLLVQDLATDQRIRMAPRPRFRTRSFLSLPLQTHQRFLGVLNLADKWDDGSFDDADLAHISDWAGFCAPLIDRLVNSEALLLLQQEAAVDPLTGAYSQPILEKRFTEEVSRCTRAGQEMVLLLVAPDRMEESEFNLPTPREEGKSIGLLLVDLLRKMDVIGRLSSGPFAVLLPDTPREGALIVAERLRLAFARQHADAQLTISCGLALFPRHGATFPALLRSAETALQQAKGNGGNASLFAEQTANNSKIIYI